MSKISLIRMLVLSGDVIASMFFNYLILSFQRIWMKLKKLTNYYVSYAKELVKYGRIKPITKNNGKVLIVGNGPSAGTIDYIYYINSGYNLMCVNDFALKEKDLFFNLKPKYYCCIDDAMYNKDNIVSNTDVIGVYNSINSADWEMFFICRIGQEPPINNKNVKIVYMTNAELVDSFRKFQYDRYEKNKGCTGYQNVICCCLFYAISSGFNDILLVGVEFDMHKELFVEKNNDVIREYRHFYGTKRVNITEEGQIGKGEIYKYFYFTYKTLYQYKLLSEYALYKGVSVINLTINSTIDTFSKRDPIKKG